MLRILRKGEQHNADIKTQQWPQLEQSMWFHFHLKRDTEELEELKKMAIRKNKDRTGSMLAIVK